MAGVEPRDAQSQITGHKSPGQLASGVYPAAVTPFDGRGRIDEESLAKVLAWFESAGCQGAVLAGTNGEGPSLSAVEKRDLIELGMKLRGRLELILGVATPSLEEAVWLSRRAAASGAAAVLLMPPGYFREAAEEAIEAWLSAVLDRSPIPVLIYNFPQRTGVTLTPAQIERLGRHPNMCGIKDSSAERGNIEGYRAALPQDKLLFNGNETLLMDSLRSGWSGTISGAANSVPHWLSQITKEWLEGETVSAAEKFTILLPVLEAIRATPQPAGHKAVLKSFGVLLDSAVRLPLLPIETDVRDSLLNVIAAATGITSGSPMPARS